MRFVLIPFGVLAFLVTSVVGQDDYCSLEVPGQIFCDDFSDLSVTNDVPKDRDGSPVRWFPSNDVTATAESGNLVFGGRNAGNATVRVTDLTVGGDVSIQTRGTVTEGLGRGISTRGFDFTLGNWVLLGDDGQASVGRFEANGATTLLSTTDAPTGFRPTEDLFMQLDGFGDTLDLWIWRPGEQPTEPVLSAAGASVNQSVTLWGQNEFRVFFAEHQFVQVADQRIAVPEPTTVVLLCLGFLSLLAWRRTVR